MMDETLRDIINNQIRNHLLNVHISLPGKIISYDRNTRRADVKPMIPRKIRGGVEYLPLVQSVPLQEFRFSDDAYISLPVKEGCRCTLIFSERSLDDYLATGREVLPEDSRRFDLSDAYVIPGFFPDGEVIPGPESAIEIINKTSRITVDQNQTSVQCGNAGITIENESVSIKCGRNELISVLKELTDTLKMIAVPNPVNPPTPLLLLQPIAQKIEAIGNKLEAFK